MVDRKYSWYDDCGKLIIYTANKRIGEQYAESRKQNISLHESRKDGSKESHDDQEKENS